MQLSPVAGDQFQLPDATKDTLKALIAPVDPITYGPQLKTKNLLMIAASRDDIVPPSAARA